MFIAKNVVRMHDTDMAGILFFANQFRFVHDALEDFCENEGLGFDRLFHEENFVFVIVHAEADYKATLRVGDKLEVHLTVENVGNSSFTIEYKIYKKNAILAGTAKTVHVTLDAKSRKKIPIPVELRKILEKQKGTS
jgi:1,4-dihydroxy-2-naphthoyl-CoA hydrolase